jgi:hypothetical protein
MEQYCDLIGFLIVDNFTDFYIYELGFESWRQLSYGVELTER